MHTWKKNITIKLYHTMTWHETTKHKKHTCINTHTYIKAYAHLQCRIITLVGCFSMTKSPPCIHTYIHTNKQIIHTYIHTNNQSTNQTSKQTNQQTYTHTYRHTNKQTYIHTRMHACIHIHTYTYIYIHPNIHTRILNKTEQNKTHS